MDQAAGTGVSALRPAADPDLRPGIGDHRPAGAAHLRVRRADRAPLLPGLVVLPQTAQQVAEIVTACAGAGLPFVARGSGTGLSGGALPRADGVLIVLSKMRKIIAIDPASRRAVVEPGVTNLAVSKAAEPFGLFYPPDPSSQVVCSVGGNVAENSGGAHCLKHGFTVHHVTGLEIVTPAGELTWLGDGTVRAPGYDLAGAFTGSEGTLGIVTKIIVRLTPIPEAVTTLLAAFRSTGEGGTAVSQIIGSGILPGAIEMMDALAIEAAEAAVRCHYPQGAGAVLIVELDGPQARGGTGDRGGPRTCASRRARSRSGRPRTRPSGPRSGPGASRRSRRSAGSARPTSCRTGWCRGPRSARCWTGSPSCRPPPASGWPTSSTPATATCTRWSCSTTRCRRPCAAAEELSGAILDLCIEHGGSITGEHGVGVDKSRYMPKMFGADDLDTMQLLRCAFDPAGLCNPGKIFPTPRLCGEVPGVAAGSASAGGIRPGGPVLTKMRNEPPHRPPPAADSIPAPLAAACARIRLTGPADRVPGGWAPVDWAADPAPSFLAAPDSVEEAATLLRAAAGLGLAVLPRGSGSRLGWGPPPRRCDLVVDMTRMNRVLEHAAGDLVARVQAGISLERLAGVLATAGQRLALDPPPAESGAAESGTAGSGTAGSGTGGPGGAAAGSAGTVGGVLATGVAGPLRLRHGAPRDLLIGITVIRADGTVARAGGKVVKNVAGYDIGKLFAGSYGTLGLIAEATFRLHPRPAAAVYVTLDCAGPDAAARVVSAAAQSSAGPVGRRDRLAVGSGADPGRGPAGGDDCRGRAAGRPDARAAGSERRAVTDRPPRWWGRGASAAAGGTVLRIAFWPGELAAILSAARAAAGATGLDPALSGSAAAGVLHAAVPEQADAGGRGRVRAALRQSLGGGRRVCENGCAHSTFCTRQRHSARVGRCAACPAGGAGPGGHVGPGAVGRPDARGEGPVRSRGPDGARPARRRHLMNPAGPPDTPRRTPRTPWTPPAPRPGRPRLARRRRRNLSRAAGRDRAGPGRAAARRGQRLRALRFLPAVLPDLPAVGRGDGLAQGPDLPDRPDARRRAGQRGRGGPRGPVPGLHGLRARLPVRGPVMTG